MGIHLKAGRNFSLEIASDSQAVIINQSMADRLHLKDPLGKRVSTGWERAASAGLAGAMRRQRRAVCPNF